jgi:HPt (histidine-containing phosphotransfer) domain-containing protein
MRRAAGDDDLSNLKELAHWLKGSAGTVGFDALTPPAQELERAAREVDRFAVTAALDALTKLSKRVALPDSAGAGLASV